MSLQNLKANAQNLISDFDNDTLSADGVLQVKNMYKIMYKEPSEFFPDNPHKDFKQDIYSSIESCSKCLRYAINQIRIMLLKI